ncbi:MAG: hypothetical protein GDA50_00880 [Alphaproteobacteria bacterium GM202ARS2]|nr:hypothetical protein [Alphaproteobacteria bacterium GM202ARS2]
MITLFYAYARSGGTLLNRILAAMPDNVVLSEVYDSLPDSEEPLAYKGIGATMPGVQSGQGSVWHQALYWYNIRLKHKDYLSALLELADICERSGRHLIVREWCAGHYLGWNHRSRHPRRNYNLFAFRKLPQEKTRAFALVRHGADTFKSLESQQLRWDDWSADYATRYLAYARDIHKAHQKGLMPLYDYAELCAQPDAFVEKLCSDMALPFDKTALSRFSYIITACGDVAHRGRHADSTTIRPLVRRVFPSLKHENLYRTNSDLQEADRLLDLLPDKPLNRFTHALKKKAKKYPQRNPLPPLFPCQELSETTPLWCHSDIMSPAGLASPSLPVATLRHVATIPPGCVVVVLYARLLDSGVVQTLQALDDAPSDFPPRAFIVMTHRERGL